MQGTTARTAQKPVVIVGAGRHGRNVFGILSKAEGGHAVAGFIDDTKPVGEAVIGCHVLGGFELMDDPGFVSDHAWFVALGDARIRCEIGERLLAAGASIINVVHPSADVSEYSEIGVGVFVAHFTWIGSLSRIEDWALIEGYAHIGCDVDVGRAAFIGPACVLTGGVKVGEYSFLGTGAVVSNEITVGANCVVGANSAVVRDIPDGSRAQGLPARVVSASTEVIMTRRPDR